MFITILNNFISFYVICLFVICAKCVRTPIHIHTSIYTYFKIYVINNNILISYIFENLYNPGIGWYHTSMCAT